QVRRISEMVRLISVRQKEPMGLGHAVLAARPAVGDEWFGVLLGDDLIDSPPGNPAIGQLARVSMQTGKASVALMPVPDDQIQLTDALAVLAQQKRLVGVRFEGERHDAGDRLGYLQANIAYALKRPDLRDGLLAYLKKVVQ